MTQTNSIWTALTIIGLSLATAGCLGEDSDDRSGPVAPSTPVFTPAKTSPTPAPAASPEPMTPKIEHNKTYVPTPQATIANDSFAVATAWTEMTFTVESRFTANCYQMASEPPAGTSTGPKPTVTFVSPSGTEFEFALPQVNTCGTAASGPIGNSATTSVPSEQGDWTITFAGRGFNVSVHVLAVGS